MPTRCPPCAAASVRRNRSAKWRAWSASSIRRWPSDAWSALSRTPPWGAVGMSRSKPRAGPARAARSLARVPRAWPAPATWPRTAWPSPFSKPYTSLGACSSTAFRSSACRTSSSIPRSTTGIPEFRLPDVIIDTEIDNLRKLGVEIRLDTIIGKLFTIPQLLTDMGYDSVFIGTGAGSPKFMGIPGEAYNGVFSANEFLTRVNLMRGYQQPIYDTPVGMGRRVAVVGAGNTAMDSARVALRMGAESVSIVYRRSRRESPARAEELEHAIQEGIQFRWLTNPVEIPGNSAGWVTGLRCQEMELGEPDASGRRRPVPK